MALPIMTPEQRDAAREKARQVRGARADLKACLKRGEVTLAEAIRDEVTAKMKVSALIESLPGMGKVRAKQVMERLGIAENRRVGGLGPKQRAALETAFAPVPA
jgi:hypothetical protein